MSHPLSKGIPASCLQRGDAERAAFRAARIAEEAAEILGEGSAADDDQTPPRIRDVSTEAAEAAEAKAEAEDWQRRRVAQLDAARSA